MTFLVKYVIIYIESKERKKNKPVVYWLIRQLYTGLKEVFTMSQYIHFFVRSTDRLLPIHTTSRSSSIYHFFSDYAPYGKARTLSMHELQNIREEINMQIDEWARRIEEDRTNLQLIASFNNPIENKIEVLESACGSIRENEVVVSEMKEALAFTHFLMEMYNEAEYTKYEDETARLDPTKYLYFGVECGTPSIAEIEEWENSKN